MDLVVPDHLWKLTISPGQADSFEFCRQQGIVGVGWGLSAHPQSKDEAKSLIRQRYGRLPGALNAVITRMKQDHHVWVYGDRRFWVCRIDSDWEYRGGDPWDTYDIHHYRKVTWKPVPAPLVPGVVKRSLFLPGTAQEMKTGVGEATRELSAWLFETYDLESALTTPVSFEEVSEKLDALSPHEALQLLDSDEVEDLAGLWVQSKGWRMLKSSTYRQRRTWECEFTRSSHGVPETAYMQVKSGNTPVRAEPYLPHLQSGEWLFLLSTAIDPYPDRDSVANDRLVFVEREDLLAFLTENLSALPPAVSVKLGLATGVIGR